MYNLKGIPHGMTYLTEAVMAGTTTLPVASQTGFVQGHQVTENRDSQMCFKVLNPIIVFHFSQLVSLASGHRTSSQLSDEAILFASLFPASHPRLLVFSFIGLASPQSTEFSN